MKPSISAAPQSWAPSVSKKQLRLMQLCRVGKVDRRPQGRSAEASGKPKYLLVSGPRKSSKTMGCMNAIADHLWNVKNDLFTVLVNTATAGIDGGPWKTLHNFVIPQWIEGNFGMQWVTPPREGGTTKKPYFEVTNKFSDVERFKATGKWNSVSRCQLDSLKWEKDVEAKFKGKEYCGLYVSELSLFRERKTFDILKDCLRGAGWTNAEKLFIGDTNPADDGTDSWIYKLWYEQSVAPNLSAQARHFFKLFALMEFAVSDNPWITAEEKAELVESYGHSQDLTDRYLNGLWVKAVGNSVFFEQFRPRIHILGDPDISSDGVEPEIIVPHDACFELLGGWDIGSGPNSAFIILEKYFRKVMDKDGHPTGAEECCFAALDEVVFIGSDASMGEFVAECLEKIEYWEEYMGKKLNWRHWSDRSAFNQKERIANIAHHAYVFNETKGKVILQAVAGPGGHVGAGQGPGSVRQRLDLTRKLLFQNRLFVCRSRCPNLIDSLQSLRPGKGGSAVEKNSKYKHAWDAGSYAWVSECYEEIMYPHESPQTGQAVPSMITVRM